MKRKLCLISLIIVFYSLQGTFCKAISLGGICPNLMIILPVCFGYFKGRNEGMFVGFFSGLFYDLYYADIYGFSILAFTYAGFLTGMFSKEYNERKIIIPLAITGLAEFVYEFLIYVGAFLLYNKLNLLFYASRVIIPSAIYTMLLCFVVFRGLLLCSRLFEYKEKRKVSDYAKGSD